ncbi:MAG: PLP-dependent lyase/thiolase [Clostridiales bacterium]|nr:PLP-dependent lyase/thiolase [Clostridiales bacterium]
MRDMSYQAVMSRRNDIMKASVGLDYDLYESGSMAFDYESLMTASSHTLDEVMSIQSGFGVGNTPLIELKHITDLARACSKPGKGARIFVKDEACNPSGSFKARRAALSVAMAKKLGYKGVVTATSGNYGAAVASCAAKAGLRCVVLQECFDSKGVGQPEIIEKARKCEAFGAEVMQLSVGPELFYVFLKILEETSWFNASLYTPYAILGIETLGAEIAKQFREKEGRDPDMVIATNAGGGNLTGTARGLKKLGCKVPVIASSVNLQGLHMASDSQFNQKSFTTGHTGFGIPFTSWPDRSDVPRSAARPLRYMDDYYILSQGEVFFITEALAQLEGMERGPAGNTSLAAAFSLSQDMDRDRCIIVQETEYTGAGKHHNAQLSFAASRGIDIRFGNPREEVPGRDIILPQTPENIKAQPQNMNRLRSSLIRNALKQHPGRPSQEDIRFLCQETNADETFVRQAIKEEQ